tara:strand:+ start:9956 stop:10981 length:1026 start_codon:yes stop_codon:yes gene_type:complete
MWISPVRSSDHSGGSEGPSFAFLFGVFPTPLVNDLRPDFSLQTRSKLKNHLVIMSPIGRVFIVLNLVLAAGFVFTGGQLLQNQHKYKQLLSEEQSARKADAEQAKSQVAALEKERNKFDNSSNSFQQLADQRKLALDKANDDNLRLGKLTSSQAADLKKAVALQEAANTLAKSAFDDSRKAYKDAIAAIEARDAAVNAKNAAEGEARNLNNEIAALNDRISQKDLQIAALDRDNQEKNLLVAAAQANGFINAMAAPDLAGTVTNASGRLCTISIGENPGNVDIQSVISRMPFRFAIYDDNGFKAEAVATKYEPSANAVLCNLMFTKGEATIRTGDKASTKP